MVLVVALSLDALIAYVDLTLILRKILNYIHYIQYQDYAVLNALAIVALCKNIHYNTDKYIYMVFPITKIIFE